MIGDVRARITQLPARLEVNENGDLFVTIADVATESTLGDILTQLQMLVAEIAALSSGDFVAVTADDDTDIRANATTKGLYIGTGGHLRVKSALDQLVTFKNIPGGSLAPFKVKRVLSSVTTASDIVAVF